MIDTHHHSSDENGRPKSPRNGQLSRMRGGAGEAPEPIAIIGLGCRFPGGADNWREYWRLLEMGVDAISETPADRWNLQKYFAPQTARPGKTQSKWGGYVRGIDAFDPQLFGISPREAASMDPQQRMLLEVAFRAMEDAGQPLEQVAGKQVSVFVGISSFDYAVASLSFQDRGVIDAYSNTGGSSSIAANRISYCFDLSGPSVAVDTACSSSLVAIHLACESIWQGEAVMALAGGVNALLLPDFYVAFSQLGVLSPDGRCKTFDARANGYVRSEGAGMVMLKPLSAALRDKDPIYAVIRSSVLNQDGRTPGMTVPSQAAQQRLIEAACQKARIEPAQIQYVEAHGTGTPVGDPIEAAAIGTVLGRGRAANQPCRVGSVKTNIGHLEAGSGVASLIKVALALHHRRIPAHLHFQHANPAIDFDALGLSVPTQSCDWDSSLPRLAGINGFGYGGANAHVILEEAPPQAAGRASHWRDDRSPTVNSQAVTAADTGVGNNTSDKPFSAPVLLPLSARSKPALSELARTYAEWFEQVGDRYHLAEVAGFMAHRRSHHNYRATVSANSLPEMIGELQSLANCTSEELDAAAGAADLAHGPAFICSGQGPQWWAMGRGLLKYSPAFRSVIKRCDAEFAKYGNWSLLHELTRSENDSRMQRTSIAQPSIFAIQVALAAVWESWGIRPAVVVGHSVGEIAAAYLSGGLSWEDAACVAFHRGRTMDLATSQGAMLAAGLAADEVPSWLEGIEDDVSLAAINGPSSVTISGAAKAIELLAKRLEDAGVFCRRLAVEYAFHSVQMEPVRDELLKSLRHIRPQATHTPLISTVTGGVLPGDALDAEYWWKNVRQAVRFSDAMTNLAKMGCRLAIEVGPHPVLAYAINECFQAAGCAVRTVPSLNRQQDDLQCITKSLGSLYALGVDIHWSGFYNKPTRHIDVPTYPFQLQRCWSESLESRSSRTANQEHPLLGETAATAEPRWQQRIDLKLQSYLAEHAVRGAAVYPAAAMIETALAAVHASQGFDVLHLERFRLHNPCVIGSDRPQWIQTDLDVERRQLRMSFRDCDEPEFQPLATIGFSSRAVGATPLDVAAPGQSEDRALTQSNFSQRMQAIRDRCTEGFDRQRLYDYCRQIGLEYGSAFQGAISGLRRENEALVEVTLPIDVVEGDYQCNDYFVHPSLLDSCFHSMIAADPNFDHTMDGLYLPAEIRQIVVHQRPSDRVSVHVCVRHKSQRLMECDLDIYNPDGQICISIRGFESRRVSGGAAAEKTEDLIYSYSWIEQPLPVSQQVEPGAPGHWIVFMDEGGVGRELTQRLLQRGDQVSEIYRHDSQVAHSGVGEFYQVDPESKESFTAALADCVGHAVDDVDGLVYLWGLDVPRCGPEAGGEISTEQLERSTHLTSLAPLHMVQAWEQSIEGVTANLTLVTAGAQSQDGEPECTEVAAAPLIGLGRVIASETARFRTKLVDLPRSLAASDVDSLLAELLADDEEDEVLWRGEHRYVHRFTPHANKPASSDAMHSLPIQLHVGASSSGIEELHYRTKPVQELAAGQVEISVVAAGLNFSDVMKALDLYPGLPDGPVDLGAECSGYISRVGKNSRWQVGDEVIAIAPGGFASHVVVNETLVARKPGNLTHEQAAALPVAFLTAEYALNQCARLRSGDSILIHAASGGVGLAAMQLAKLAGVRVLATAGTDAKRQFVRDQGASCVMDSRSLAFGEQTLAATDGRGVDAVLNSLPGEAIATGLSVLKVGGRFLEIGKRDIYADAALGLYPFRNNLALFAIDLDQLFKQQPQVMGDMLRKLAHRFENGELQPLPVQSYSAEDTKAAYRFMQQGKHIGKVVVNMTQRPSDIRNGEYLPLQLDPRGTYWLAGGMGGFGLEIAKWMAGRGAKSLVLSGRSGVPSAAARRVISELEAAGTRVSVLPADITRREDVRRVLAEIDNGLPPLRGVIHTAMVLEDKLLVDLDRETLERVLRPKVLGGWNLHCETLGRDLDCFVLFSSLSSVFGHAGQANYSAANALLDSLAYHRRAQGLAATVMNWGHLGEVGYLAEREQLGQRLERQGVLSFTVKQATDCLEYALQTRALQLSVLKIDWSIWRGLGITNRVSPRFAGLLRQSSTAEFNSSDLPTAQSLRAATAEQRPLLVERLLRSKAGSLLGIAAEDLPANRALLEMGLDSLMAVEMRNWIEAQLQVNIAISDLMRGESLNQIVQSLSDALATTIPDSPDTTAPANRREDTDAGHSEHTPAATGEDQISKRDAQQLLEQLPDMGADEVAQLLSQMLGDN